MWEPAEPAEAQGLHTLSLGFISSQHHFTNSSSCVPAFQPSIFSQDPTYFPACHTAQSCAQTLSQSFWSYLSRSRSSGVFPLCLIDAFHIMVCVCVGGTTALFTSLCLLRSVHFLYISCSFSLPLLFCLPPVLHLCIPAV